MSKRYVLELIFTGLKGVHIFSNITWVPFLQIIQQLKF